MVNTYGKQWNLWQVDRGDVLPCAITFHFFSFVVTNQIVGLPQLMMVATGPGEWNSKLFEHRDQLRSSSRAQQMPGILPHVKAEVGFFFFFLF